MTIEWLTLAVIGGGAVVIWWSVRTWIKGVNSRFDTLISEMQTLSKTLVNSNARIASLENRIQSQEERLNNYAGRLRDVEIEQAVNSN